jgi:hypothetical protein
LKEPDVDRLIAARFQLCTRAPGRFSAAATALNISGSRRVITIAFTISDLSAMAMIYLQNPISVDFLS